LAWSPTILFGSTACARPCPLTFASAGRMCWMLHYGVDYGDGTPARYGHCLLLGGLFQSTLGDGFTKNPYAPSLQEPMTAKADPFGCLWVGWRARGDELAGHLRESTRDRHDLWIPASTFRTDRPHPDGRLLYSGTARNLYATTLNRRGLLMNRRIFAVCRRAWAARRNASIGGVLWWPATAQAACRD